MFSTAIRTALLSLVLYTGPAQSSPAETTGITITITVTIPAALIAHTPICSIG
jgi:hypothetical protein